MGKIRVEVCIISARGLGRSSSLWKLQWFAVGWIDPNSKYCTKIDSSGSANPAWKTKFSALIDDDSESNSNLKDVALHVQVYSRDPIFLREKLRGTAIVLLKEFVAKYTKSSSSRPGVEEVGSFQLRKKNSGKPLGFVDVSIRICEQGDGSGGGVYDDEGFKLAAVEGNGEKGAMQLQGYPSPLDPAPAPLGMPTQMAYDHHYYHPAPFPPSSSVATAAAAGPSYHQHPPRAPTPPPPPPPSHVGYLPTFLPRTDHLPTYINLPPSASAPAPLRGAGAGPGFGMGMGAGALAAGAVLFGDDFMSGFDIPSGLQDATLTISTDPLF